MSAGFTPGPWETRPSWAIDGDWGVFPLGSLPVLGFACNYPGRTEANARLIAAAPELYEALDDILIHCLADIEAEEQKDEPNEAALTVYRARRDKAQSALAKARGE